MPCIATWTRAASRAPARPVSRTGVSMVGSLAPSHSAAKTARIAAAAGRYGGGQGAVRPGWRHPAGATPPARDGPLAPAASDQLPTLLHQPEPAVELLRPVHEGRIEVDLVGADALAPL